jgi:hypothetical protein
METNEDVIIDLLKNNQNMALSYLIFTNKNRNNYSEILEKISEETLLQYPHLTYIYIEQVVKKRYKKAEKTLVKSIDFAYKYSLLINERFPLAEKLFSEESEYAYLYAKNIIKNKWKRGEKAISQNVQFSFRYAKEVLKKRFLLGEEKISESPEYCFYYAEQVINKKLPTKMHNKMIAYAIEDPKNYYINKYFEYIST